MDDELDFLDEFTEKTKNNVGPPSKFNRDTIQRIFNGIRKGWPENFSATVAGVAKTTFIGWKNKGKNGEPYYEEFYTKLQKVKGELLDKLLVDLHEKDDTGRSAMWLIPKYFPEFKENNVIEHRGSINSDVNIDINKKSTIELKMSQDEATQVYLSELKSPGKD